MPKEIDFITRIHTSTARDYLGRVNEADKSQCAELALKWGFDYWDGDRKTGYGGYTYDGRWRPVAEAMATHYGLDQDSRILDVGCGKGFLLYEFTQILPGCAVTGLDVSDYAIENAKPEIQACLRPGTAAALPFDDDEFDFVYSINTLHNLFIDDLFASLHELDRVSKSKSYLTIEAYRNEREKMNLLYWQLTCRAFHTPEEWQWIFERADYDGDFGFIYFE
ncbi:MAG: class I SAM-dependent methyltransferase [Alphaproteobacteria bacterium]